MDENPVQPKELPMRPLYRVVTVFLSIIIAYFLSYFYIGLIGDVFEKSSGTTIGVGGLALIYPMILSTIVFFYLVVNLINELINSSGNINIKAWIINFIIGLFVILAPTVLVLLF